MRGTHVELQDLLWLAVAAGIVLDDMQRTIEVLRRRIGDDLELRRLSGDTIHMVSLLEAFQEAVRAERAGNSLDELPDLSLVQACDDGTFLQRLLLVPDNG